MRQPFKEFDFWYGVVFGLYVAAAAALLILIVFNGADSEYWDAISTLSAIIVGILSALAAFMIARYQLEEARRRDLDAARAVLPLALVQISPVIGKGLKLCASRDPKPEEVLDEIVLPETVTQVLRDCIRSAREPERAWLSLFISRFQVTVSRTNGHFRPQQGYITTIPVDQTRAGLTFEWAVLHGILSILFDFSREQPVAEVLDRVDVGSAVLSHDVFLEFHSQTFKESYSACFKYLDEEPATPQRLRQL